ncbi:unnamed protein product [Penicillium bialowiezense]
MDSARLGAASGHRRTMSVPFNHSILWCLGCLQRGVSSWLELAQTTDFQHALEISCIQDSDSAAGCQRCHTNGGPCVSLPSALERHRLEFLALLKWVAEFWGWAYTENGVKQHMLLREDRVRLTDKVKNLVCAFERLVSQHIQEHQLGRTKATIRTAYYEFLAVHPMPERTCRVPITVRDLTQCAKERRGLVDTESDVHLWYGAMRNFILGVTMVVDAARVPLMHQAVVDRVMRASADLPHY